MSKFGLSLATVSLAIAGTASICKATSSPEDTIKPFISSSLIYDSNFLRISDNNPLVPTKNTDKSEFIKQVKFGFDLDWKFSKQHFLINANANQNWFQNFNSLDYLGWDTRAQWNWQIKSNLDGEIGYTNTEELGNFTYTNSLISNLSNSQRFFANAGYLFHPNGKVKVDVFRTEFQFSGEDESRQLNKNVEDNVALYLQYLSPTGSKLGVHVIATEGEYPLRKFTSASQVDNAYTRMNYALTWEWLTRSIVSIDGVIGYTHQNFKNISANDFSDVVGYINMNWKTSDKLLLKLSVRREISQFISQTSSFLLTQGIWLTPVWQYSEKFAVTSTLSYRQDEFLGNIPTSEKNGVQRKDEVGALGLGFLYKPLTNVTANTEIHYENRDSNQLGRSYDTFSAGINLKVDF